MSDQQDLHNHLFGAPDLWVVELDDPGTFPAPTWGPFATAEVAGAYADRAIEVLQAIEDRTVKVYNYVGGEIARVYELPNGKFLSVKKLTPPAEGEAHAVL